MGFPIPIRLQAGMDAGKQNFLCSDCTQRWFYLDVFACGFLDTSKNVPEAPARARQCRPTGRRAQGIFGAEWPSTRPSEAVVRAAGKTCCAMAPSRA